MEVSEKEIKIKRQIESILENTFAYNVENDRVTDEIYELFSVPLDGLVMQKIAEVIDRIEDEVGYTINNGGGCDNGVREYGASDDGLIQLTYNIIKELSNFSA